MAKTITALDLGSFETRAILIKPLSGELPQVIGVGKRPSRGIKKGLVVDINEASQTIREVLEMVATTSGDKVGELLVAVNGTNVSGMSAKGVVAVSRADREITSSDVDRAIKSAQATLASPNREIISILPRGFCIDNEEGIRNPIGMNGIRLEADTIIISASSPFLRNLSKAVTLAGQRISELVPGPLACGEGLVTKKQKDLGVAVLDIGSDTTSVVVYEDGEIFHLDILPVGSNLITSDIAIGLRIDIDSAETIKIKYGTAIAQEIRKSEIVELEALGLEEDLRIRRYEVAQIIEARTKEIVGLIGKSLEKVGRRNFLPAGVILAGGGSKLEGIVDLVKEELKLPVRLGFPEQFGGLVDEVLDPAFSKAAGLAKWKLNREEMTGEGEELYGNKVTEVLKDFFRRILP